jgi:hypothetical protein
MIFKIFSPKKSAKKLAFLTQNKAKLCKILVITLVFEKNAHFFGENCKKSQKIVIITSTPGGGKCGLRGGFQAFNKSSHLLCGRAVLHDDSKVVDCKMDRKIVHNLILFYVCCTAHNRGRQF